MKIELNYGYDPSKINAMRFSAEDGFIHPLSYYFSQSNFNLHLNEEILFLYRRVRCFKNNNKISFKVKTRRGKHIDSGDIRLTMRARKSRHYNIMHLGTRNDGLYIYDKNISLAEYNKHGITIKKDFHVDTRTPEIFLNDLFSSFMKKSNCEINTIKHIFAESSFRSNSVNINEDIKLTMYDNYLELNEEVITKKSDDYGVNIEKNEFLGTRTKGLTDIVKYNSFRTGYLDRGILMNEDFFIDNSGGKGVKLNEYVTLGMHSLRINIPLSDTFVDGELKGLNDIHENIFAGMNDIGAYMDITDSFVGKHVSGLNIGENGVFINKDSSKVNSSNNNLMVGKEEKAINLPKSILGVQKDEYKIDVRQEYIEFKKEPYVLSDNESGVFIFKNYYKMNLNKYNIFLGSNNETSKRIFFDKNIGFKKISKKVDVRNNYLNVYKGDTTIYINANLFVNKNPHSTILSNELKGFNVISRKLDLRNDSVNFTKISRRIWLNNKSINLVKAKRETGINKLVLLVDKGYHSLDYSYSETWMTKNYKNARFEYNDIFLKKFHKKTRFDYYIKMVSKAQKHTQCFPYYEIWANKLYKKARRDYDDLFLTKNRKKAYRLYLDTWATKKSKDFSIDQNGIFISKKPADIGISNDITFVEKSPKDIGINNDFKWILKEPKSIYVADSMWAAKVNKDIEIGKNGFFLVPFAKGVYFDDNNIWAQYQKVLNYNKDDLFLFRETYRINTEKEMFASTNNMKAFSDENIKLKMERKKAFKDEIDRNISQERKKVQIEKGMFVHVMHYKDDDMKPDKKRTGNIDELLMPHKDYTYNEFLSKLILPNGSVNPAHVTNYDPTTNRYTVNIPVENPIKIYADIARDYIDVDTGIMEYVIYLIKSIWRKKMYKYISMYADEALEDILTLLHAEIDREYENINDYNEALRCLQLFRWYSEMAILNNCEYELAFDTREIRVDYANKSLAEFRDMTILNNMYISDNYILEAIDKDKPCSVTFVNLKKHITPKLDLHFKLYNVNSKSSISIIDGTNSVDTIYEPGIYELDLELKDKIVIVYDPDMGSQNMAIAGITISNLPTRNFSVTYKGKFGNINPVMQELLDKMLITNTTSAAVQDKFKNVTPTTVAIDTIVQYFELHHQDKLKGKRLTTKK